MERDPRSTWETLSGWGDDPLLGRTCDLVLRPAGNFQRSTHRRSAPIPLHLSFRYCD